MHRPDLEQMMHDLLRIPVESAVLTRHEGTVGHETIKGITHEGELEISRERFLPNERAHLLQREMPVGNPREFGKWKPLVDEETHLLQVLRAHVLAQRLPHRMRACLGDSGKDETVLVRNDHPTKR